MEGAAGVVSGDAVVVVMEDTDLCPWFVLQVLGSVLLHSAGVLFDFVDDVRMAIRRVIRQCTQYPDFFLSFFLYLAMDICYRA
jgi:hypothetical protein